MDPTARNELALAFGSIALAAGQAIMAARAAGSDPRHKPDGSPVTQADLDADRIICRRLAALLPGVPVVTEEATHTHGLVLTDRFVLVDPLDGTREFTAGHDEFTVNIALIDAGLPSVGAIYAPALNRLYLGGGTALRADVRPEQPMPPLRAMLPLRAATVPDTHWRAVASRSHLDPATERWLADRSIGALLPAGSSLKFCAIAEGAADVYPRLAPTREWDIAAGHAILAAAGGSMACPDGSPLRYGKQDAGFENPSFVAWGRRTPAAVEGI